MRATSCSLLGVTFMTMAVLSLIYHEVFFKGRNRRRWAKPLHRINVPSFMLMAGRSTL